MSRPLVMLCLLALPALADEIVNGAPSNSELGRYTVHKAQELTARLDSATGAVWFLCPKKSKQAWCRAKDVPSLPAGPVGRYRLTDTTPLMLVDSVTGRAWQRCDLPTPEKGLAWCALED